MSKPINDEDVLLATVTEQLIEIAEGMKNINEHVNDIHKALAKQDDRLTRLERKEKKKK